MSLTPESARGHAARAAAFNWRTADAFLFDIDGTLLNSRDAVHYFAFSAAVREVFGLELRIDGIPVHGNTDVGILRAVLEREGVSAEVFQAALPRVLAVLLREVERNREDMRPEICASVEPLILRLRAEGKLLGVVTGNLEPIGWAKLERAGLRDYFSFGAFSGHAERRADIFRNGIAEAKRRLGPAARIHIVGDTPADVLAAREVGVPVIAVATGIFPLSELQALAPEMAIGCCDELVRSA